MKGIYYAMEFLHSRTAARRRYRRTRALSRPRASVVIIGGGDTGADCLGTSIASMRSVLPVRTDAGPPKDRAPQTPAALADALRTESSHEEGGKREWPATTNSAATNTAT
jgi:glutamate synthase (NADPH/NADH) small chain